MTDQKPVDPQVQAAKVNAKGLIISTAIVTAPVVVEQMSRWIFEQGPETIALED